MKTTPTKPNDELAAAMERLKSCSFEWMTTRDADVILSALAEAQRDSDILTWLLENEGKHWYVDYFPEMWNHSTLEPRNIRDAAIAAMNSHP